MKTKDELHEDICNYCPLPEERRGVYGTPGGFSAGCEGCRCNEAYEAYKEECTDTCIVCGEQLHLD